jgi:hypothetical protein
MSLFNRGMMHVFGGAAMGPQGKKWQKERAYRPGEQKMMIPSMINPKLLQETRKGFLRVGGLPCGE